jgi:hypothetical protein
MAGANAKNKRSVKENSNRAKGGSKASSGRDSHKGDVKSDANSGNPALRGKK